MSARQSLQDNAVDPLDGCVTDVEAKVKELSDFAYTLDGDMLKDGYILACQAQLKSDVVVEVDFDQKGIENLKMT